MTIISFFFWGGVWRYWRLGESQEVGEVDCLLFYIGVRGIWIYIGFYLYRSIYKKGISFSLLDKRVIYTIMDISEVYIGF